MPIDKHYILPGAVLIVALLGSGCGSGSELETIAETTETSITATTTIAAPSTTSTTTVTPQPTVTMLTPTVTTSTSSPTSTLPATTVTISEAGEVEPYVLDEFLLVNPSDRSTPIGTLCWAMLEWGRMSTINLFEVTAVQDPRIEIIYPAGYDHEYTLIDALEEIAKPEIVSIADSPQFSEELQLFAKAFFEQIRTDIKRIDEITSTPVDYNNTYFAALESLPHLEAYFEATDTHTDQCIFPEAAN